MLASIDWLKQYVDIDVTPEELAEKLTRVGLEVESVNYLGEGIEGVITGKVTQIERHPDSDHLWVCMMDVGGPEIYDGRGRPGNFADFDRSAERAPV